MPLRAAGIRACRRACQRVAPSAYEPSRWETGTDLSTSRATDEIVGKAINRTLYNWDSANNKLALELATSVTASADGLVHTFKLRDDAYFHNGRKMTADDVIASFTRIMDGAKAYPGARFVRIIKGAIEVEKGQAKEISGLKKIDDTTFEMALTSNVDPGYYFFSGTTAILPKEEVEKGNFAANPVGLGPFKFKEHIPGSRVVAERCSAAVVMGELADELESTFRTAGLARIERSTGGIDGAAVAAAHLAREVAAPDGSVRATVLLSPIGSSFDMFNNPFGARGEACREAVHALPAVERR
mgnify:CR=1 FL=1